MGTSAGRSSAHDDTTDLRTVVETGMHQLRNPLQTIAGFAEILTAHGDDLDPDVRATAVEAITRNAARAARLVEDIDRAVERGLDRPVRPARISVADVVTDVVGDCGLTADTVVDVPPHLQVRTDRDHITEILTVLVDNADRYGQPPVRVTARAAGEAVQIMVEDAGDGVPPDFVEDLFTLHTRAEPTGEHSGKGVGLATARRLARRNDGSLRFADTPPSRGARFVLELPLVAADDGDRPARLPEVSVAHRPVLHDVQVHRRGTQTTASARLAVQDRTVTGEAAAEPTLEASVEAVVNATLRALENALAGATTFEVEQLTVDRDPSGQVVVRVRAQHGADSEELVGAAITHDDHIGAAVKATLGAVNRRFEHLARSAG